MEIGYRIGGGDFKEGRPSIVFVHGAGGSSLIWLSVLSPLSRKYNTIALDLPGHGQTPPPDTEVTVPGYANWVKSALEELAAKYPDLKPGRYIMAGHSMGGAITQTFALSYPQDPAGLILVSTGAKLRVAQAIIDGIHNQFESAVNTIVDWSFALSNEAIREESRNLMLAAGPDGLHADFVACDRFDLRNELHRIEQPTLIIAGSEDQMTPPKFAAFLDEKIPDSQLVVMPGAGHSIMAEKPKEATDLIAAFADKVFG